MKVKQAKMVEDIAELIYSKCKNEKLFIEFIEELNEVPEWDHSDMIGDFFEQLNLLYYKN